MEYKRLPDLDGWATLRAVVEQGGVSEAAKVLHVGQPAVTKRLRALEECYGLPLVQRVSGRLRLTEVGDMVYQFVTQTLDRHRLLQEDIANLAQGKTTLRLAVSVAIGEHFLPELLLQFSERHPNYRIDSRLAYSRQIKTDLATGRADMALIEFSPDHPDILVQKWQDDELWLVCGANHPLTGTELLPVEQLTKLNYVLRERRSSIRESLDAALHAIGVDKIRVAMEVGSSEAIIDILERGRHVSFMPRFVVYDRVKEGELFHLKVTGFRIMRTLWIARNRGALNHPVAEAFIKIIREALEKKS